MAAGKPGRSSWQIRLTSSEMTPERIGWLFSIASDEPEKEIPLLMHIIAGIRFSGTPELPAWGGLENGAKLLERLCREGIAIRGEYGEYRLNEDAHDFSWLHSRNPRTDTVIRSRNSSAERRKNTGRDALSGAENGALDAPGKPSKESPEGAEGVSTKLTEKVNKVDNESTKLTKSVNKVDRKSTKLTEKVNKVDSSLNTPSVAMSVGSAENCPNADSNSSACTEKKDKGAQESEDMSENDRGEGKNPSSLSLPVSLPSSSLSSIPPISTTSHLSTYSYLPIDAVGKEYTEVKKGGSYIRLPKKEDAQREGNGLQDDAQTDGDEEGKRTEQDAMAGTEGALGSSSSQCNKASADGDYLPGLEPESAAESAPEKPSVPLSSAGSHSPLRPPAAAPDGKGKLSPELARDLWNENCPNLQRVAGMSVTSSRYRHFVARVNEAGLDEVIRVMKAANSSPFFVRQRQGGNGWQCTFDWLMLPTNFWKTADGAYANDWSAQRREEEPQFRTTDYFIRKNAEYTEEDARRINEQNFAKIGVKSFKQFALNAIKAKKEAESAGKEGKGERA